MSYIEYLNEILRYGTDSEKREMFRDIPKEIQNIAERLKKLDSDRRTVSTKHFNGGALIIVFRFNAKYKGDDLLNSKNTEQNTAAVKKDRVEYLVEHRFGTESLMPLYVDYVCRKIRERLRGGEITA